MKMRFLLMLAVGVILNGCGGPPTGVETATVREPATNTSATTTTPKPVAPAGPVKKYATTEASEFKYTGYKIVGQHSGTFILFEGLAEVPGDSLEEAVFTFEAETLSTETDNEQLTRVIKGKDFFWCDEHPKMTFKSTKIEKDQDGYAITGDLTLRGVTKTIQFPAKIEMQGETLTLKSQFTVNRKWWNMIFQGIGDNVLKEDVLIELNVAAKETK